MTHIVELEHVHTQEYGHKFAKWECVQTDPNLRQAFRSQYPDIWLEDTEKFAKALNQFIEDHPMKIVREEPYVCVDDGWYKVRVRYEVEYEV